MATVDYQCQNLEEVKSLYERLLKQEQENCNDYCNQNLVLSDIKDAANRDKLNFYIGKFEAEKKIIEAEINRTRFDFLVALPFALIGLVYLINTITPIISNFLKGN